MTEPRRNKTFPASSEATADPPKRVAEAARSGASETASESETEAAGEALGRDLRAGDVVLLYGDLGAGKTAFVRGMARGIGANPADVSSPTFTIVQEYAGPSATLYHVDLYRLEGAEIDDLGLEDLVSGDGIVAIEWAERWTGRPDDVMEVRIKDLGDDRRSIELRSLP
ncbi:MAG TPA: tRNA (adenosine(37)-N6)-threonylcarbamoyltransferase complex ATPase subunit type 1 TsaE [Vicinamibacterales bacterium]